MISLYYSTDNPFCHYGINHFIEKFGIPLEINKSSQSGIILAYGVKMKGDFVITLEENEIENTICGKISCPSDEIPVCEIPRDTGSGDEVIAHFNNNTIRYPCVTRTNRGISIGIDIFKETGYLLSGHLDAIRPSLNSSLQEELASKPVVDFLENVLFNAILAACHERQILLVQKSIWPDGKKFAVCLTHDVDEIKKTYQWVSRPLRFLARRDISGFKNQISLFIKKIRGIEPYYTFDDIMRIEGAFGAKSTYFILKETGIFKLSSKKSWYFYGRNRSLHIPEMLTLLQKLQTNGDEVALHGSFFSYCEPECLMEQTRELEGILHEKIIGTRQHNLNLDVPATWKYQLDAGIRYDSTLGFKDTIGFRWGTSFPFFPNTGDEPLQLLEIPLIIMDICLESMKNKTADCLRIADEAERHRGVLTLLWHPPVFNTLEYPEARDIYIKINEYCLERQAWITRARDVYEWLSLRKRQTFSCHNHGCLSTIIPAFTDSEFYFTLHLPPGTDATIHSENANIIRRDGDCIYIKTHNLQKNNEISVGII